MVNVKLMIGVKMMMRRIRMRRIRIKMMSMWRIMIRRRLVGGKI